MEVLIQKGEEDTVSALSEEQMPTEDQPNTHMNAWSWEYLEYIKVSDREHTPYLIPQTHDMKSLALLLTDQHTITSSSVSWQVFLKLTLLY